MLVANASGVHCTTKEEIRQLLEESAATAVWTKTLTKKFRVGNESPRVTLQPGPISGNSVGLANFGVSLMLKWLDELKPQKPVYVSLHADQDLRENIAAVQGCEWVAGIEINVSCPNVNECSVLSPTVLKIILGESLPEIPPQKPIGLKMPYIQSQQLFVDYSNIIDQFPQIKFITTINGLTGLLLDDTTFRPFTKPRDGITGIGGAITLPFALYNVREWRRVLPADVLVFGVGGITNKIAAQKMWAAGADGIQIGTWLLADGLKIFDELADDTHPHE